MNTRARLQAAITANTSSQAITIIIQAASLPIFLTQWDLQTYGSWLLLSSIPTFFSLSDLGFLTVATNRIVIETSKGEKERSNRIFQSAILLWIIAFLACLVISSFLASIIDAQPLRTTAHKVAFVLLVASAILSMAHGLVEATFRANSNFGYGIHLGNLARLTEWIGMIAGIMLDGTFLGAAIGQFSGRLIITTLNVNLAANRNKNLRWRLTSASFAELKELTLPALTFMLMPISNAISIQGMTIIISHLFGPGFLAIFNTYRTVSRILVQIISIASRSVWPEISMQFGKQQISKVKTLYVKGTIASITTATALAIVLLFTVESLLSVWTKGQIPYQSELFYLFLFATLLTSTWQMGMVLLSATNNHSGFAIFFLASSLIPILATVVLSMNFGQLASAWSLIASELVVSLGTQLFVRRFFINAKANR